MTGRWIVLRTGVPLAEPGVGTKCIGETGTAEIYNMEQREYHNSFFIYKDLQIE